MDAFIDENQWLCVHGKTTVMDNYVTKDNRVMHKPRHQQAAACVFDGQYSNTISVLLKKESTTTHKMRKAAMIAKHPRRTTHDDDMIQELPSSLESQQVNEEMVYETIRKPTRRRISPEPNVDRFKFLQSVSFNPYESVPPATVLHLLSNL